MKNVVDTVLYVNENRVVVYLEDRHFEVNTDNGSAVALVLELLKPYFDAQNLKTEQQYNTVKQAA